MKFKVGDIVGWLGARGKINSINPDIEYPIKASFIDMPGEHFFTSDGRYYEAQEPSLKFIGRCKNKKKVKKTIEIWVNVYPDGQRLNYSDRYSADANDGPNRIACVKLTGEYEVEE